MIDASKFNLSKLVERPFRYAVIKDCITQQNLKQLRTQLPLVNNYRSVREAGSDKTYNVVNNILLGLGSDRPNPDSHLSQAWQSLVYALKSNTYIQALSHLLDEDLAACHLEITLKRYGYGDFISAHTDKALVRATHMIFLNQTWDTHWGGQLCFMHDANTPFKKFLPLSDRSIAFVRSDNSWHAVDEIIEPSAERIAIQVAFWNVNLRTVLDGRIEQTVSV